MAQQEQSRLGTGVTADGAGWRGTAVAALDARVTPGQAGTSPATAGSGLPSLAPAIANRGMSVLWQLLLMALVPSVVSGALFFWLARHGADPAGAALASLAVMGIVAGCARLQQRALSRPLRLLVDGADLVTARYSGEVPAPRRCEIAALARSFDAMTSALLQTIERTRETLEAERQNGIDLQRQYALMQLLRDLASAVNEGDSLEGALRSCLEQIGDYLDWPVGRLVVVVHGQPFQTERIQSHWYAPDEQRFVAFIEACAEESNGSRSHGQRSGLIGRAIESSLSHWITDLGRLENWMPGEAAKACGLRTGFVIPIAAAPEVTALIEFYADHRIEASAEMLELVEAISVELWRIADRCAGELSKRSGEARARRLAMIVEHMEQAVLLVGAEGRVEWANAALIRLLDSRPDQCLGADVAALLFAGDASSAVQCRRIIETGEPVSGLVLRAPAESAPQRCYELEIQPLPVDARGAGQQGRACFLVVRDAGRTRAALAPSAAPQTAGQAGPTWASAAAGAGEVLRSPLAGGPGSGGPQLSSQPDERRLRFIESLYRSGQTLLDRLNEVLDLSNIEAGKLQLQAVDFDLRALVEELIELLAPRARQKRIEISFRLLSGVPSVVHGDASQVRQVLINVLGNAIKFTEQGEVVLTIAPLPPDASSTPDSATTRVRFDVRDTGIGIPAEMVERLFAVFAQTNGSSSRRYSGTGLGLAIARQLTEMMGGSITVRSQMGRGSTFCIDLPLRHGAAAVRPHERAGPSALPLQRAFAAEGEQHHPRILEEPARSVRTP